jgi:hypothetical protein
VLAEASSQPGPPDPTVGQTTKKSESGRRDARSRHSNRDRSRDPAGQTAAASAAAGPETFGSPGNGPQGNQPAGLRAGTQPLAGGPPATAAEAVAAFWEPLYSRPRGFKAADGWTYYPMLTGAAYFDDNVFAAHSNKRSDWAYIVRPELALTKSGQNYGVEAHGFVEDRQYAKFKNENQVNGAASLGGTAMVDPNTQFQGRAQYMRGHEERGVGETTQSSATFDRPVSFDQFDAAVALNHRQDRWWNSLGAAGTVVHFSNPTVGGVPQDQSFRNGDIEAFPMRVGYVVAPFTSFFVEGALNRREFDLHEFDSRGYRVVGGILAEPGQGQRVRGEAFAGYMNQDYRGPTFQSVSTWTFGASMALLVADKLTMTLAGSREAKETGLTCLGVTMLGCGSSLVETWGAARLDYLLLPNLVAGGGVTYLVDDIVGNPREDRSLRPLVSARYFATPWLTFGFDYRYINYDSSGLGVLGYNRNVYLFSAHAKL